ncbi:MAG: ubiquinone biosynthesis regulatory protein kinase UbiB [Candidatus Azosocius agrarius]|nr:MAG: ubiquinone biosynthesis regulatory protein kinase UbiB [Gammaproteobacteria bacterium]
MVKFYRIIFICYIFIKYNLFELIIYNKHNNFIMFIVTINNYIFKNNRSISIEKRIKMAFEELGPVFIKLGQILSMRVDIVPSNIVRELIDLQNHVVPFHGNYAIKLIENSFSLPINVLFKSFDINPVAAASVAQVHRGILFNGKEVAIKILRPNIIYNVKRDMDLLLFLIFIFGVPLLKEKRHNMYNLILEIKSILLKELNLNIEAANACKMRKNFLHSKMLIVPNVYWNLTKHNILTMDFLYGISINNIRELNKLGFDIAIIAKTCVKLFFIQVFRDKYFHADMHPGNILVSPFDILCPKIILLDYGIMGFMSNKDQKYMGENMLSFIKRDYRRIAELHILSGWIPQSISIDNFEQILCSVWEPIFNKELKDISFEKVFSSLIIISKTFDMKLQPQLLLFQKTLLSIEGLSRYLYPKINFWRITRPILEKWVLNQFNPNKFLISIKFFAFFWLNNILEKQHFDEFDKKSLNKDIIIANNKYMYLFYFLLFFVITFFIMFILF